MEVTAENKVWFGGHCMSTSNEECKKKQKKEDHISEYADQKQKA
jgi:hypothetical protein